METKTISFTIGEEKKHSVRYEERVETPYPHIRTIYVSKSTLGTKPYPQKLKMTLEDVS